MSSESITTIARRIARAHNQAVARGLGGNGKLVFGLDGSGGAWYSDSAYGFGDDCIVVPVEWGRMSTQAAEELLANVELNAEVLS